jgi:hypothetical protein
MAKHTLEVEYDYDFDLIGISCHLKDYRFCWILNRLLNQNLERQTEGISAGKSTHILYHAECPETRTKLSLIVNRSKEGLFVPEQKQIDFLLVIRDNALIEAEELIDLINADPNVLMSYSINPERIKAKEYLLMSDI